MFYNYTVTPPQEGACGGVRVLTLNLTTGHTFDLVRRTRTHTLSGARLNTNVIFFRAKHSGSNYSLITADIMELISPVTALLYSGI